MLLPFLVGKNPPVLASGVSGDFGGPAEARSNLLVDLFSGQSLGSETHIFFGREGWPRPLCFFCVFLGRKKWDEHGHGNFWT